MPKTGKVARTARNLKKWKFLKVPRCAKWQQIPRKSISAYIAKKCQEVKRSSRIAQNFQKLPWNSKQGNAKDWPRTIKEFQEQTRSAKNPFKKSIRKNQEYTR